MIIFAWMLFAAFMLLGFMIFTIVGIGAVITFVVNLALLPLRILLWVFRLIFRIF